MKIATVSLDQVWEDKEANLNLCEKYLISASKEKAELIIFPEMTLTGFSTNINKIAEEQSGSETIENFKKLALEYKIAILFGVVIKDGSKALNKSIFINESGNIIGEYSKIHPFSFSGEDRYFNAGKKLSIVNYKDHKIGLTICYDLRFPELYSAYGKECDAIVNIANWPKKRVEHWNTLLRSRAIENQLFVVGVNRTGIDGNGLEYEESSVVFNASGENVEFIKKDNMKIYDIDKNFTKKFREAFNTINDRKVELYRELI